MLTLNASMRQLAAELMTSIVDGKATPHDLGWLMYTNPDLSASYIDFLAKLSPAEKSSMLNKAILARNVAVVDKLLSFRDLALTDIKLQQLGIVAAVLSGSVELVEYLHELKKNGRPTFNWGVGSFAVLEYCHEHYYWAPSNEQASMCAETGSVKLVKKAMELCGLN